MSKGLSREEYLSLSEDARMAARLNALSRALEDRRSLLRERGVAGPPGLPPATQLRGVPYADDEMTMVVDLSRTREAAGRSGITHEQAERFLQELEKKSAG